MNERIRELAEQAGLQPYYDAQEAQIERFAELIVRECADIADKEYNVIGCGYITKTNGMRIREHFGVE